MEPASPTSVDDEGGRHEVVICIPADLMSEEPLIPRDAELPTTSPQAAAKEEDAEVAREPALDAETKVATCSFISIEEGFAATMGDDEDDSSLRERIREKCAASTGLPASQIELFELRPLDAAPSATTGGVHIGVRIKESPSSARVSPPPSPQPQSMGLSVAIPSPTNMSVRILEEHSEMQRDIIKDQLDVIAQRTMEVKMWEEKAKRAQTTNDRYKSEYTNLQLLLQKSERQWREGQTALDKLKEDFRSLCTDISDQSRQIADQEDLLFTKFDLSSPDERLGYLNAETRKNLGSKNLSTLIKVLESPDALATLERLTAGTPASSY